MTPTALTIAAAVALYLREARTTRRLRAELGAAVTHADWLRRLLERRGGRHRLDAGHEQPAGPRLARPHEPPRHG